MKLNLSNLFQTIVGKPDEFTLKHRLFNAYSLFCSLFGLIAFITNYSLNLGTIITLYSISYCIINLFFFILSRKQRYYRILKIPFISLLTITIVVNWMTNAGIYGPTLYFAFAMVIGSIALFEKRDGIIVTVIFIIAILTLFSIHLYYPELIIPYTSKTVQILDLLITYLLTLIVASFLIVTLMKNYDEKTQALEVAHENVNNAYKLIKDNLIVAKEIQSKILPKNFEEFKPLLFHISYIPQMEIGGDLYDIHNLGKNKTRIFLADATGHGIQASLLTMLIKSEYEKIKNVLQMPHLILDSMNKTFTTIYKSLKIYFTAITLDINTQSNEIIYSIGGHPAQLLVRDNQIELIDDRGKAIGLPFPSTYNSFKKNFNKKDKLLLFTDGLFEASNNKNERYGEERLLALMENNSLGNIASTVNTILINVSTFMGNEKSQDDTTIIGVEFN